MEELALFYVSNLFLFLLVNPVNTGSCMQSFYHVYIPQAINLIMYIQRHLSGCRQ